MSSLTFQPLIPVALWVSLLAAAAGLLWWYGVDCARRLGRGKAAMIVALMAGGLAMPSAILLNPTWQERVPPPSGKPVLTVLVDNSASMATADNPDGSTRFAAARQIAAALNQRLQDRYEVRLETISDTAALVDSEQLARIEPQGMTTNLAAAISNSLQAESPAGQSIVLLSDGIHNVSGELAAVLAAQRARAFDAAIYCKTLGGATGVRDLAVDVMTAQDLAFVGQKVPIQVDLRAQMLAGQTATVCLVQDEREIERREVPLGANEHNAVEFNVSHDRSGLFSYEIRVEPAEREATEANNTCSYVLRIVDEPIRILLLEGKPYWDTKFLMRTLAADASVEIVSVVQLTDRRFMQRTLSRPSSRPESTGDGGDLPRQETWQVLTDAGAFLSQAALESYQVIVLGREAEQYLDSDVLSDLRRWLAQDGGSLVCFRGAPTSQVNQQLAALLPVRSTGSRETRFHVRLTEAGRELRWLTPSIDDNSDALPLLPSLATRSEPVGTQPLAVVWAVGDSISGSPSPVVASMPYGTGRVVVLEGAGMWRWAFMAPEHQKYERIYSALWQSLTRWLVCNTGLLPNQNWALRSDRVRYSAGESTAASLLVRPTALSSGPPRVELTGPQLDGSQLITPAPSNEELGAYRVVFGALPEGRYQASIVGSDPADATARTVFEVRSNVDEVLHLAANESLMARLARESGGSVLDQVSPDELAASLDEHLSKSRPEQIRTTSAWDRWWVLASVLALWACAWSMRRNWGLI